MTPTTVIAATFPLDRGEQQLWTGIPPQGLRFRLIDVLLVPFSLLWGGFAIFWEVSVIQSGAPFFFIIWGVPFVGVGLYFIAGRFWFDSTRRARTRYAVTSERILIASGVFKPSLLSLDLASLRDLNLEEDGNGTGSILFGAPPLGGFRSNPWSGQRAVPAFEGIPDARAVYQIIRDAKAAAEGRGTRPTSS